MASSTAATAKPPPSSSSFPEGEIHLPSSNHQVVRWKAQWGSVVQQGETVALISKKEDAGFVTRLTTSNGNDNPLNAGATATAAKATTTTFKRPKKRQRLMPKKAAAAAAAASSSKSNNNSKNASTTTTRVSSLKNLISKKTSSTNDNNGNTNSSSNTDIASNSNTITKKTSAEIAAAAEKEAMKVKQKQQQEAKGNVKGKTTAAAIPTAITVASPLSASATSTSASSKVTTSAAATTTIALRAPCTGILEKPNTNDTTTTTLIAIVQHCQHPTIINGLCVICGDEVNKNYQSNQKQKSHHAQQHSEAARNLTHDHDHLNKDNHDDDNNRNNHQQRLTIQGGLTLNISQQEAQRMAQDDRKRLHGIRKLSLVLDLDHTLVHATQDKRAKEYCGVDNSNCRDKEDTNKSDNNKDNNDDPSTRQVRSLLLPLLWNSKTDAPIEESDNDKNNPHIQIFHLTHYLKLRPHVQEFLQMAHDSFELSVYTAGTRHYARQVMQILARHHVGVTRDEPDLQELQQQIEQCRGQLHQWRQLILEKKTTTANGNDTDEKEEDTTKKEETGDKKENPSSTGQSCESTTMTDGDGSCPSSAMDATTATSDKEPSNNKDSARNVESTTEGTAAAKANTKAKKKSVSFGALPPKVTRPKEPTIDELNDWVSQGEHDLKKLQNEWEQAQKDEQKAQQMCQKLFGGRIVSRTDTAGELSSSVKSLKRMFPCGGSMAVIVDDREDVWSNADNYNEDDSNNQNSVPTPAPGEPPHNLLLCRPYHWGPFAGFADVNNAAGEDLSEMGNSTKKQNKHEDNDKDDHQLLWTADMLKRIHAAYYSKEYDNDNSKPRPTVPELVYRLRQSVLHGSNMLLSSLVPLHRQQADERRRARPHFVRHAENLGAVLHSNVSSNLTHVVAAKDGTEKVLSARRIPRCVVVRPSWLMECVWTMTHRDEKPHIMRGPVGRAVPKQPKSAAPLSSPPVLLDRGPLDGNDLKRQIDAEQPESKATRDDETTPDQDMVDTLEEKKAVETSKDASKDGDDDEDDEFAAAFEMELEDDDDDDE